MTNPEEFVVIQRDSSFALPQVLLRTAVGQLPSFQATRSSGGSMPRGRHRASRAEQRARRRLGLSYTPVPRDGLVIGGGVASVLVGLLLLSAGLSIAPEPLPIPAPVAFEALAVCR